MDAAVDSYRHFMERKVPRGVKLVGWLSLGVVQIYTLRCLAAGSAAKQVAKIREKEESGGGVAKK